jgi:hypothetical protein
VNFEDELRATMRAHDAEAPRVADLPPRPWQRRRPPTWLLAAAAAVVVAAIAVPVAALSGSSAVRPTAAGPSHHTSASVATTAQDLAPCPTKYRGTGSSAWVPALPRGVDGAARLVPETTPSAAVVCAYLHGQHEALTGQKLITGALARLATQLSWMPRRVPGQSLGCDLMLRPTDGDAYLVELQYPGARVWVAVNGDHCTGASNGTFVTTTNLRADAAAAYASHTWPAAPTAPCRSDAGRLGDEHALVPGTPIRMTICSTNGGGALVSTDHIAGIVAVLNRLAVAPDSVAGGCNTEPGASAIYDLRFGYRSGPDAEVMVVPHCSPEVFNAKIGAQDGSTVLVDIHRLLGKR